VYVAREIQMHWPESDDRLSMRIGRLSFKPDIKADSAAYRIRTTIPRDRWIRVGGEVQEGSGHEGSEAAAGAETRAAGGSSEAAAASAPQ